jgi:Fe2+ or Zn2+ uptake regulation protein
MDESGSSGDTPAGRLRSRGLRVTAPRVTVLTIVHATPHLPAPEIVRQTRDQLGTVSVQGVYDVLAALTDAGLLRRIEPAGSPARYEARVGDNHHHLVCRGCGRTVDVDCAVGEAPCLTPHEGLGQDGFVVDEAEVVWWGWCPDCQVARAAARDDEVGAIRHQILEERENT